MNILEKISATKREEVQTRKKTNPVRILENSPFFHNKMPSFSKAISLPGPSVIAEFKRKSPSRGDINKNAECGRVATAYQAAGVSAISVLTDEQYFGGSNADLRNVAGFLNIPILRKDFIIDEYQVIEAKSIGAAAILLIASILTKEEVTRFSLLAKTLGMDVLFEIHEEKELEKMSPSIGIIGVNNRDLGSFEVSLENSVRLLSMLPSDSLKVAESGFSGSRQVKDLHKGGYDAFLIGEYFMKNEEPGRAAAQLINEINYSER
jgi:indole-3-glycerol phosphate synthase